MQNLQSFPRWLEELKPQPMSWGGLTVWSAEIPVARLRPNTGQLPGIPKNPRTWSREQLGLLAKSLEDTPELFAARGCLCAMADDCAVVIGGNMRLAAAREVEDAANAVGWQVRQQLIWNKNNFCLSRQDYRWKHEPCFYGWKSGAAHYFSDSRSESTVVEDVKPENFRAMKKDELVSLLESIYAEKRSTTVLNENKPSVSAEHPTMKPVKLMARLIRNSTRKGDAVLDIFAGSGSTLIACEQIGRRCYALELDPHYCDVIIDRWEKMTGRRAEKIN